MIEANTNLSVAQIEAPLGSRHQAILGLLQRQGIVRTKALSSQLGVTEMTIRRDLDDLNRLGRLKRVHGGATLLDTPGNGNGNGGEQESLRRKQAVARAALGHFPARGTIYLDAGSTAMELARVIPELPAKQREDLRIVTHAPNVAAYLATHRVVGSVHQIGDELDQSAVAAVGPQALEQIARLYFDLFFMGVRGADLAAGWTNNDLSESKVKQAAMSRAAAVYVLADSSKWRAISFTPIAPLGAVSRWIVDRGQQGDMEEAFRTLPVRLAFAD